MNFTKFIPKKLFSHLLIVMAVAILTLISPGMRAQATVIAGVDHIGINVPDLADAIRFFHDMFGFEPVTKLGPFSMDKNWKKSFHMHDAAKDATIIMMRAGDGSNIELFEYKPAAGSTTQPFRDNISATHISLYTADIAGTKKRLESKGIHFLTDIISGSGDTEGEKWVYFETPWGSTIELNSYPNGKGYEKKHPALQLWTSFSSIQLTTATISQATLIDLGVKLTAVLNDKNPESRLIKMREIYMDQVVFYDEEVAVNGLIPLNDRFTVLLKQNMDFNFSLIKMDNSNNVVRYFWNYGPASNPTLISGMDMIILKEGKIRSANVFIDGLPPQAN